MFSKLAILFISAAAIVSAMPTDPAPIGSTTINETTNKCNVGKLSCCSSVQKPSDSAQQNQLGAINGALGTFHALLGIHCNPISALIGHGAGSNCNAQPVCCSKNIMNGLAVFGCDPVNVNI